MARQLHLQSLDCFSNGLGAIVSAESNIPRMAKRPIDRPIVSAALMIVAGLVAVIIPVVSDIAATALIGWLLVVSGLLHLFFGWDTRGSGGFIWELLLGFVYGIAGIYLRLHPTARLTVVTAALVTYLSAEASLEFAQCWFLRQLHGVRWIALDAALTLAIAILIWMAIPSGDPIIIGASLGISMTFSGISRVMLVLGSQS